MGRGTCNCGTPNASFLGRPDFRHLSLCFNMRQNFSVKQAMTFRPRTQQQVDTPQQTGGLLAPKHKSRTISAKHRCTRLTRTAKSFASSSGFRGPRETNLLLSLGGCLGVHLAAACLICPAPRPGAVKGSQRNSPMHPIMACLWTSLPPPSTPLDASLRSPAAWDSYLVDFVVMLCGCHVPKSGGPTRIRKPAHPLPQSVRSVHVRNPN